MLIKVNVVIDKEGNTKLMTVNGMLITHIHEFMIPHKIKTPFPKLGTMICFGNTGLPIDETPDEFEPRWWKSLMGPEIEVVNNGG